MRRIMGLAAGLCALVVLVGAATASAGVGRPQASWHTTAGAAEAAGAPGAGAAAVPGPAPETVGTVEQVGAILDYLGARRSATLRYPGASFVKVHFNRLLLLPGDTLTVADPQGREVHSYSSDPLAALVDGGRWAMSVTGDTAVVALHSRRADPLGLRARVAHLGIGIDKVARGFTPREWRAKLRGREESVCGGRNDSTDAACYRSADPIVYNRSKAVARLLINGVELCTAWRVGPGNRMFTNHHCVADSFSAKRTEVWFNYECAVCGGWEVLPSTKVWANQVLATDHVLDYTLFTVHNFADIERFGYLDLDVRDPARGEKLYIPQHPGGDPTKISMDGPGERNGNCSVADPSFNGYGVGTDVAYYCDTEGGSSGSPVLSRETNRVVALHHFGGCPNSGARIDLIYREVAGLL
jgi:hypothetical protein